MKTTSEIFRNLNRNLALRLIPDKTDSIECNSFSDLNEDVINFTLKQHGL